MIRCMTAADYDAVWDLWMHTPGMGLRALDDSRPSIERFLQRNASTCFVSESDSVNGVILCGQDGRRGYIYHLAVRQDSRRHGIGRALVQAVLAALEQEGVRKVALVAFEQNELGNAFWTGIGFARRDDLVYRDFAITPQ